LTQSPRGALIAHRPGRKAAPHAEQKAFFACKASRD
jgi:hypothetical protein